MAARVRDAGSVILDLREAYGIDTEESWDAIFHKIRHTGAPFGAVMGRDEKWR
jgi:hypothetical protein